MSYNNLTLTTGNDYQSKVNSWFNAGDIESTQEILSKQFVFLGRLIKFANPTLT